MADKQTLTKVEFDKLINVAKLTLTEEEKPNINNQLSEAVDAVKILNEADESIETIQHPTGLRNITRPDEVGGSLTQEEALSNAKRTHEGYFVVDAILDHK